MSLVTKVAQFFRLGRARYLVGTDLERNSYYELPALDGDTDPRRTRRMIRYAKHKPLGEYNYKDLPIQWRMWLRHTRKSAPTVEELEADQARLTQLAERVRIIEQREAEERLRIETNRQAEHANSLLQSRIVGEASGFSQEAGDEASTSAMPGATRGNTTAGQRGRGRATAVPTSNVSDEAVGEAEGVRDRTDASGRILPDDDVWAASRARLRAQDAQAASASQEGQVDDAPSTSAPSAATPAMARRADRRARLDQAEELARREKERARRQMFKSPVEDFEIEWEAEAGGAASKGGEKGKAGNTAQVGLGNARAWASSGASSQPSAGADQPQGWGGKPVVRR